MLLEGVHDLLRVELVLQRVEFGGGQKFTHGSQEWGWSDFWTFTGTNTISFTGLTRDRNL